MSKGEEEYNWTVAEGLDDLELDDDDEFDIDFDMESLVGGEKVVVDSVVSSVKTGNELVEIPGIENEDDGPVMICPVPNVTVKLNEGVIEEWSFHSVMQAIDAAAENPIFNFVRPGLDASDTARYLQTVKDKNGLDIKLYADFLVGAISEFIGDSASCKKKIAEMLKKLHGIQTSRSVFDKFSLLLVTIELPNISSLSSGIAILHGFIIERVFYAIIKKRNEDGQAEKSSGLDVQSLRVTEREEKIIRKVAGFIPFSLKKHYFSCDSQVAKSILQIVKTWNKSKMPDTESLIDYTNEWVDRTNRGGLFLVTDNFYRYIVRVEITARKILNSEFLGQYAGQDVRKLIMDALEKDPCVHVGWDTLMRSVTNQEVAKFLKKLVLSKWINIRANAFVKAWVDQLKLKQQLDKDGSTQVDKVAQPSLRKSLAS